MEKFIIPNGFKNFPLEMLDGNLCSEQAEEKELVLICAPITFDINTLNDEQVIENGSKLLDSRICDDNNNDGELVKKWELHTSSMCRDMHLNALLPSNLHGKHVLARKFSLSLNIMPSMPIPPFTSPKKEGVGAPLPRPCGLRTRWNPFGAGDPLCKQALSRKRQSGVLMDNNSKFTVLQKEKQKHKSKSAHKGLSSEDSNFECNESLDNTSSIDNNCEVGEICKKKTKKHKTDVVEVKTENSEHAVDVTGTSKSNKDDGCVNKETKSKKKKKKKEKTNEFENGGGCSIDASNTRFSNIDENCTNEEPKQKKKKKIKEKMCEIDAVNKVEDEEHTMDVSNVSTGIINNRSINEEVKSEKKKKKKKKKKRATCALDAVEMENSEVPNTITSTKDNKENEVTASKKKKKKKPKIFKLDAVKLENDECTLESTNTSKIDNCVNREVKTKKKKKKKMKTQNVVELHTVKKEDDKYYMDSLSSTIDNHCTNDETKINKKKKKKSKAVKVDTVKKENDECVVDSFSKKNHKNNKTDTNSEKLMSSNGPLENNDRKMKKRKRKSDKPLKNINYIKEEEPDDTSEHLSNGLTKSVSKEAIDFDSDLDSDTEARILGATPRKRMCSR